MLRSAASPGSRGVRPARERCEWPPHTTASGRPPFPTVILGRTAGAGMPLTCPLPGPPPQAGRKRGRGKSVRKKRKGAAWAPSVIFAIGEAGLLDLALTELDVLLGDRIVLLLHQLLGLRTRVLLGRSSSRCRRSTRASP